MLPRSIILMHALLALPSVQLTSWFSTSPRVDMNFTQMVHYDGYESEWYHVTTYDGYVLSVFRVLPHGPCRARTNTYGTIRNEAGNKTENAEENEENKQRIPILMTHGMYLSGDDCVVPGPNNAHCYLYADACHDVWVFNARGSRYSRAHVNLDPDTDPEFWNFAFDEMALLDLPATIDFVLRQTNQKQIAYVGHSQGAAILMLLCAKIPKYNDKIKIGFGLSPTMAMSHSRFINVKIEGHLSLLLPLMDRLGSHFEVFAHGRFAQQLSRFLCSRTKLTYPFCSALIFSFIGYNGYNINSNVLPVLFGHLPSGTSAKNYLRWGQIVRNGFSEYDYGKEENLLKYGVQMPPMFDLSKVTMEWMLIGSTNDYIADLKDMEFIAAQLPQVKKCVLSDHSVGHLDFLFGSSVRKYIVPMILTRLDKNMYKCF